MRHGDWQASQQQSSRTTPRTVSAMPYVGRQRDFTAPAGASSPVNPASVGFFDVVFRSNLRRCFLNLPRRRSPYFLCVSSRLFSILSSFPAVEAVRASVTPRRIYDTERVSDYFSKSGSVGYSCIRMYTTQHSCSVRIKRIIRLGKTRVTGSAVALHCCKAHAKINRKIENSTPCKIVTHGVAHVITPWTSPTVQL